MLRFRFKIRGLRLLALFFCLFLSNNLLADQAAYSEGLSAYANGNYELAQSLWLKAARQNHARAMFNLGLIHQQQKIPNSDAQKARRWFTLAAKEGYVAADYHHAVWLLQEGSGSVEARLLLKQAALNGYVPAQRKLKEIGAEVDLVRSNNSTEAQPIGTSEKNFELSYLDQQWLVSRNPSAWTVQILAFTELEKVKAFIDTHRLHTRAAYFVEHDGNKVFYKLVYGEFKTKEAAQAARAKLTPALQEHGPWLRTLASVQRVIKKQ